LGEADDVREQHGDSRRRVSDDPVVVFETPRHGLGEDVEQQALGLGLLELECLVLVGEVEKSPLASPYEVLQQHVRGGRDAKDVEYEEADHNAVGDIGRASGQRRIDRPRHGDETPEDEEPGHRLTRPHEQQRPDRRRKGPQTHRRRRLEAAQAPLQEKGNNRLIQSWLRRNSR